MTNTIHIAELTKGMNRQQRRQFERTACSKRNQNGPRVVDRTKGWQAVKTMIALHDATPLDSEVLAKNNAHIDKVIDAIDHGEGTANELASVEQFSLTLFFLVLRLKEAGNHDTAAIIELMIAEDQAEDCAQAHAAMEARHKRTRKIGWTAQERAAVILATNTLKHLLRICNGSHARQALIDAEHGKKHPVYIENRAKKLAKLEKAA